MSLVIDHLATLIVTRRGTLALGSAATLLGLTQMGSAVARKNGKNKKSRKKQSRDKVAQLCGPQVDECAAYFTSGCSQFSDPQRCASIINTCCAPLAECQFAEMIQCMSTTPME